MNTLKSNLDTTDRAILCELQRDARLSYAEIERRIIDLNAFVQDS